MTPGFSASTDDRRRDLTKDIKWPLLFSKRDHKQQIIERIFKFSRSRIPDVENPMVSRLEGSASSP